MSQSDDLGPETSYGFKTSCISPNHWNFVPTPGKLYKVTDSQTNEIAFVFVIDVYETFMNANVGIRRLVVDCLIEETVRDFVTEASDTQFHLNYWDFEEVTAELE